jgi:hypothetical protein
MPTLYYTPAPTHLRWWGLSVLLIALSVYLVLAQPSTSAETKALAFLQREVPAWKSQNGCFSCHNNGDAARALFIAKQRGYQLSAGVLTETLTWLRTPHHWEENKGDPGLSDKRLANVQFAASLLSAVEAGEVKNLTPLRQAARKLLREQDTDGCWKIDAGNTLGSPTTWGTPLATWMALRVLQKADLADTKPAQQKAYQALAQMQPNNVATAATLLLAVANEADAQPKQAECVQLLRRAQTSDGGWGPYPDAPAECFDTALVLLAFAKMRNQPDIQAAMQRGRAFLIAQQNADGSWPATTRPAGGNSYAQMVSTTAWATIALLEMKE